VTDKLKNYAAAKHKILSSVEHRQSRHLNNGAEVSHHQNLCGDFDVKLISP